MDVRRAPSNIIATRKKTWIAVLFPITGNVSTISCVKELLYYFVVADIEAPKGRVNARGTQRTQRYH